MKFVFTMLCVSLLPFARSLFLSNLVLFQHPGDETEGRGDAEEAIGTYPKQVEIDQMNGDQSQKLSLSVHRNGEAMPCGFVSATAGEIANAKVHLNHESMSKFEVESSLTELLLTKLNPGECGSKDDTSRADSFAGYCDAGQERTVIQYDSEQLRRIGPENTLPCRFYTREGLLVDSVERLEVLAAKEKQLTDCFVNHLGLEECATPTLDLYAVPAGRVFMFAPKEVGEKFVIDHVEDAVGERFVMEVVSLEPRVFELFNFFTLEEADQLMERALSETDELFKLQRSTINGGLRSSKVVS